MIAEELKVQITAEVDKAIRNMKRFETQTGKTQTKTKGFGKSLGDIKVGALAVAGGITAAIGTIKRITEMTKRWIDAASDAAEINSKFNVTFDDMTTTANKAAREIAEGYGIANTTAKELLANTGDMLSGFGATDAQALDLSTRVQQLAVDLASFTNYSGGAKGAADALTKGLLGEREMMKSLGIAIGEADVKQRLLEKGQQDLEGTALKMARAEATLELAYEQSANAIGDYERTQESYANVARRSEEVTKALREELGKKLIPAAGTLKGSILQVKEEMLELITASNDLDSALEKIANNQIPDFNEQMALANRRTIELRESLAGVAQGKISGQGLKDLFNTMFNLKDVTEEITEENRRNQTVIENMEKISIRNEKIASDKADAEEAAADAVQKQIDLQKELLALANEQAYDNLDYINRVLYDNLSPMEQQKQNLQEQLEKLESMKGFWLTEGAAAADNQWKVDQLNEAIAQTQQELIAIEKMQFFEIMGDDVAEVNEKMTITAETILPGIGMAIIANKEKQEEWTAAMEQTKQAMMLLSSVSQPVFDTMGKALVNSEIGWLEVGKAAVRSIATIIRSLGEQAAVQAAMAFATGNVPGGIAWSAASAGAFITSGVVSALADTITAANGADFITAGPQMVIVGDNPGGRERVSVTPLSSPNRAGPGGGVVININSPVFGVTDLYKKLSVAGSQLARRGRM